MRLNGRACDELRLLRFERGFVMHPEGSVLVTLGNTKIICNATVEERVPAFLAGKGRGWVTAEYAMLPRATGSRSARESETMKRSSRSVEIQRLIGRALRMAVDMEKLGERTITIDCDVIQADGGTRTASISGGFVALADACEKLVADGFLSESPLREPIAAISVGVIDGEPMLDLCYAEDSCAEVDMNLVMNARGEFVEIQGTGENAAFPQASLIEMLKIGTKGCAAVIRAQKDVLNWK